MTPDLKYPGVFVEEVPERPWTTKLWIYDLQTNKHFTLKENPLKRSDLDCKTALTLCGRHDFHRITVNDMRLVLKAA
jgi:hypothetical protein